MAPVSEASASKGPAVDLLTVVAAAVLVYATALMAHELAHALTGLALGGQPTLVSSTDTRGDWSGLGERDILLVGVSGSAVNGLLALTGWLFFRRRVGRPSTTALVAWLVFAVNAWIPVSYLVVSPAFGFGDWATIIDQYPNRGPFRASLVVTGLFVAGLLWKETGPSLARLVGNGSSADRSHRARRIARGAWLSGGAVAVVAALFSPLDTVWALSIAVGSTLGTTWPMLAAVATVGEHPVPGAPLVVERSWAVVLLGAGAGAVLVGLFGPGVHIGG